MAGPPTFIELSREEQALELRSYLRSIGASLQEKGPENIEDDMQEIISKCDTCLKTDLSDIDIESFLCSIVSVIIGIGTVDVESKLVIDFSQKLLKYEDERFGNIILKTLWLLYGTVDPVLPARFQLYSDIVDVAKRCKQLLLVYKGINNLNKSLLSNNHTKKQKQSLFRQLHGALIENGHSELAAEVMIELLRNYTSDDGKQAKDDAKKCIASAIADPKTFLFEPLLYLTPVISLQNTPLHELLVIFVSGNLTNYLDFYKGHKDLIKSLGLDHQANVHKMKLLTVMSLAVDSSIISFETIQQQVQINAEQVEPFLLELFGTKLVRGRMDQAAKKVNISSSMNRTFSKHRWQVLRDSFFSWRSCLSVIEEGMKTVVSNSQTTI
ncbi:Eukaryotic translation initiation factor 3 subunit M,Proteasome component (PCI) domain [Cinara cedri]|uniref:Eukaryotic translation initiation factor 3 subunit M n=1 Tax=Cinara cedri TaxID=506608 RepID=A0A5E4ND01_9HEMI|nr:Eukaryotic translation initiation factor 3 subunit M,Proteasome component (PCI) domain [Cinara cedri]